MEWQLHYFGEELSWSDEGTLKFGGHLKPNQQLKYLNAGSPQVASKQL
jgi:hypothetical protein